MRRRKRYLYFILLLSNIRKHIVIGSFLTSYYYDDKSYSKNINNNYPLMTATPRTMVNTVMHFATSSDDLKKRNDKKKKKNDNGDSSVNNSSEVVISSKGTQTNIKKNNSKKQQKKKTMAKKRTFSKDSVVSRLKYASLRASARELAQKEEEEKRRSVRILEPQPTRIVANNTDDNDNNNNKVPSLVQLTSAIDAQLRISRAGFRSEHYQQPARDSMTAVIVHNDRINATIHQKQQAKSNTLTTTTMMTSTTTNIHTETFNVAVVLSKPLINDIISTEYALRIQRLCHAMKYENYNPHVIVFIGDSRNISNSNMNNKRALLADCDVGYTYFQHLAMSHNIINPYKDYYNKTITNSDDDNNNNNKDYHIHLIYKSVQAGAMQELAELIQQQYLSKWMIMMQQQQQKQAASAAAALFDESTGSQQQQQPRRIPSRRMELHINFDLFSSEYHLCILNDIHVRSPVRSPLRFLEYNHWRSNSQFKNSNNNIYGVNTNKIISVDTSWTYMYATTTGMTMMQQQHQQQHQALMLLLDDDNKKQEEDHKNNVREITNNNNNNNPLQAFTVACYQRGQKLIPVLQNLRGVIANQEFFQRDNYRVLVHVRRSLVADMEHLYQLQPSLISIRRRNNSNMKNNNDNNNISDNRPLDVVLESALLSLGRCQDLVRPAGLLTGTVPLHDFQLAVTVLENAIVLITAACDPDRPLPPFAWGILPKNNVHIIQEPSNTTTVEEDDILFE